MDHQASRKQLWRRFAAIEYVGVAGASKDCQDAVLRYIQFGDIITRVWILTCATDHSLLLELAGVDQVAVKSGFASGYGGEGPRRFSYVMQVLELHGAEIQEVEVSQELFDRLDSSCLMPKDISFIQNAAPVRPSRWHKYIEERHFLEANTKNLWRQQFPMVLPLALIDPRIANLALKFREAPDNSLLVGYRRLEDIVRERTRSEQYGMKLFSLAFNPKDGRLTWEDTDEGERAARMNLFTGTYGAHRNRRAHREVQAHATELYSEFILLNHLYRLESEAIEAEYATAKEQC